MAKSILDKLSIIAIDDLAGICGYFSSESEVNNYYNCLHPKQEEKEVDEGNDGNIEQRSTVGKEVGKCLRRSCPVAFHLDSEEAEGSEEWMEVYDPEVLKKVKKFHEFYRMGVSPR